MIWSHVISFFFGGVFLANAVPHLVSGMMGRRFQSPFAKPPGQGYSSSTVNVLWGFFNLVVAYFLIERVGNFEIRGKVDPIALGLGALVISLLGARQFGKFNGGNDPEKS